jgi:hypothetical protein
MTSATMNDDALSLFLGFLVVAVVIALVGGTWAKWKVRKRADAESDFWRKL